MTDRSEYIKGLRALADALEAHPEVPIPRDPTIEFSFLGDEDAAEQMDGLRRALGVAFTEELWEVYFDLTGRLHGLPITLGAFASDVGKAPDATAGEQA